MGQKDPFAMKILIFLKLDGTPLEDYGVEGRLALVAAVSGTMIGYRRECGHVGD